MVWLLISLLILPALLSIAPGILGGILLAAFLAISVGNAGCVWLSLQGRGFHSTVPLIGGILGAAGAWLVVNALGPEFGRVLSRWYWMAFLLDVGTPILLAGVLRLVFSGLRSLFSRE